MNKEGAGVVVVCEVVEVVEEQVELSLTQLCRSCAAEPTLVFELVAHGLLDPGGTDAGTEHWRFTGTSLALTRRAQRLIQDLGLNVAGAVVAIELLERIERLEHRQRS